MELQPESKKPEDYLGEVPGVIEFTSPHVQEAIRDIESRAGTPEKKARMAFEIARDQVCHSFDIGKGIVTISAEEALATKQGICFAKSHLLAALLRGMDIPSGFCYQRVTRKGSPESGYALHGLNAVYLPETGWFRLDPRGNKPGIDSQFSTKVPKLAYPIRESLGEIDYPQIFIKPLQSVLDAMRDSADSEELFYKRPELI